jgi:hypothetical protein
MSNRTMTDQVQDAAFWRRRAAELDGDIATARAEFEQEAAARAADLASGAHTAVAVSQSGLERRLSGLLAAREEAGRRLIVAEQDEASAAKAAQAAEALGLMKARIAAAIAFDEAAAALVAAHQCHVELGQELRNLPAVANKLNPALFSEIERGFGPGAAVAALPGFIKSAFSGSPLAGTPYRPLAAAEAAFWASWLDAETKPQAA